MLQYGALALTTPITLPNIFSAISATKARLADAGQRPAMNISH